MAIVHRCDLCKKEFPNTINLRHITVTVDPAPHRHPEEGSRQDIDLCSVTCLGKWERTVSRFLNPEGDA